MWQKPGMELIGHPEQRRRQQAAGCGDEIIRNASMEGLRNTTGNARQGVGIAPKADRQPKRTLKILGVEKGHQRLGNRPLAALIKPVAGSDARHRAVEVIPEPG